MRADPLKVLDPRRVIKVVLVTFMHGAASLDEPFETVSKVIIIAIVVLLLIE
jgi:hypothetical protein